MTARPVFSRPSFLPLDLPLPYREQGVRPWISLATS
jgi:hypothetical protein